MKSRSLLAITLIIFGLSFQAQGQSSPILVISDIDDTIQHTQVKPAGPSIRDRLAHAWGLARNVLKNHDAFIGISQVYMLLAVRGAQFHYVSGAPKFIRRLPEKFLQTAGFPVGPLWNRPNLRVQTLDYKLQKVAAILDENPQSKVILIGDNGEKDVSVYHQIQRDPRYQGRIIAVFIHDLYPRPIGELLTEGQQPYFTSADLALQIQELGLITVPETREIVKLFEAGLLSRSGNIRRRAFPEFATLPQQSLDAIQSLGTHIKDEATEESFQVIINALTSRVCDDLLRLP